MLCEYFYPFDRGGTEWSVYYLTRDLVRYGHSIEIFTPNFGAISREKYSGISIYRFPFYKHLKNPKTTVTPYFFSNLLWLILTFIFLIHETIKFKPTHIHIQGKYFLPAAVIVGKIFRIPIIVTLRDYIILCPYAYCINKTNHYQSCGFTEVLSNDLKTSLRLRNSHGIISYLTETLYAIRGWFMSLILRIFLKRSDKVIAISKKMAKIYEYNNITVNQIIYNTASFEDRNKTIKPEYYIYIGRLTYGKGLDILHSAYTNLCNNKKVPTLLIIGDGPLRRKLKENNLGNIKYLGQLPYDVTQKYLSRALAVIIPSVWEEPFGRVALEAIANGIPVLATDRGALPEIIQNNITGIIVKPSEPDLEKGIMHIWKNNTKLRQNILKAREASITKFSTKPIEDYINMYNSL